MTKTIDTIAELPTERPASLTHRNSDFWTWWAMIAAFGTYFGIYGFRKPFSAASFGNIRLLGLDYKVVVVGQVLGYTISKFVGIKAVSEIWPNRRAMTILLLIGIAQTALLLFGIVPRPWNVICLFINGLPLGIVFGLVLGLLEGRSTTELLTAGLRSSFILAGGERAHSDWAVRMTERAAR